MRKELAFGLIGFAAAFAIILSRPGDDRRDATGVDPPLPLVAPEPPLTHVLASPLPEAPVERLREPARDEGSEDLDPDAAPPAEAELSPLHRLIAAGFSVARAEEILRRELELRLATFYAEYDTTGTIRPFGTASRRAREEELRAELGDADFERYLRANGRPTGVVVRAIDTGSAAANAGFLPGDEILSYAGQRVVNLRDLNELMLEGLAGETVATTLVRDGQVVQLYVLRGPLGLAQPDPR